MELEPGRAGAGYTPEWKSHYQIPQILYFQVCHKPFPIEARQLRDFP